MGKLHWYFYWLMDTGQPVPTTSARELLWKGQSSYTLCMYLMAWWVFGGPWLREMGELCR